MGGSVSAPDVTLSKDRTFLITGANTGIGYEIAKWIARCGGSVIIACRSENKAKEAIEKMKKEIQEEFDQKQVDKTDEVAAPSINVQYMHLDLSSLKSVIDFVKKYKESGLPLHVLICNAGVFVADKELTSDGFEKHFQVNYLSHFLLTLHLLPLIKRSGPNSRIVNVSSKGHWFAEFNLENIQAQKSFHVNTFYGNSKLFQIMSMYQLSKRLDKETVSVFSVHPGFVDTNILKFGTGFLQLTIDLAVRFGMARKPVSGAVGPLIAALHPSLNGETALYFSEEKQKPPFDIARDEAKQDIIWTYSLQCLKGYLNDDVLEEIGLKLEDIQTLEEATDPAIGSEI
ncbi:polyprenol dehydrogenase-like [Apostichopus japonicus]|uniref:polyprenol dehydrogenase-like n=1 Tax=Stichopus japonicus TaxID=307972 RepID=UPI003AB7F9F4